MSKLVYSDTCPRPTTVGCEGGGVHVLDTAGLAGPLRLVGHDPALTVASVSLSAEARLGLYPIATSQYSSTTLYQNPEHFQ